MVAGRRVLMMLVIALVSASVVIRLWPATSLAPLDSGLQPTTAPAEEFAARIAVVDADAEPLLRILRADAATMAEVEVGVPTPEQRRQYAHKIRDLASDDIPGNATAALRELFDVDAAPLLNEALTSLDLQQRQLAAHVLRRVAARPTQQLVTVNVEALHSQIDRELQQTLWSSTSADAVRYLYHRRDGTRPALRRALWSADAQQRFLAAFLLACDGDTENTAVLVRELIAHLQHNEVGGDALMAAHALHHLGKEVVPFLQMWRPSVDEQGRQLIDLVLLDLREPPRTREQLRSRRGMHAVTSIYCDPVLEFDVNRSPVATW